MKKCRLLYIATPLYKVSRILLQCSLSETFSSVLLRIYLVLLQTWITMFGCERLIWRGQPRSRRPVKHQKFPNTSYVIKCYVIFLALNASWLHYEPWKYRWKPIWVCRSFILSISVGTNRKDLIVSLLKRWCISRYYDKLNYLYSGEAL